MNGLIQVPIRDGSKVKNFVFPDIETFVDFVANYANETGMGLVRFPEDDPWNVSKFIKLKYHALTVNDKGEIIAERMMNRGKPNKIIAEGREEVIQLIRKEGF
jgi:hypothetical protein